MLQTEDALYRAAYELAVDAAAENVRYLEVRYSPVLHPQQGLKLTTVVEAVLEGLRAAKRETGIRRGVIVCGIRHISPETSLRLAELCVAYKNRGVLGFDLAGAEHDFPAKDHQEAFQLILNNNVNCTAHAGEAYGPESIAQAHPLLRRAPHRPRHAAARERRPAQLRQRPPHPARVLPVVERADARGARHGSRTRSSSTSTTACG